jgi:hypothetical protein
VTAARKSFAAKRPTLSTFTFEHVTVTTLTDIGKGKSKGGRENGDFNARIRDELSS